MAAAEVPAWPCPFDASERARATSSRLRLRGLLEAVGRVPQEEVADLALDRTAQQHAEHAAGVDLQRVGRAGAVAAEVLERPPAVERLDVALLLAPADLRRRVVGERQLGLDGLDLRVVDGLDEPRPAVGVLLEDLDVLHRAHPGDGALDVGGDVEDLLDRRVDLDRTLTRDLAHGAPLRALRPRTR